MSASKTIVISCAGKGTRLGIGVTKALVNLDGQALICRQLSMLSGYDDIRIVVGYQMEQVISTVLSYRKDVTFVFNHDYNNTGTGASLSLGARFANDLVVSLDGDLIVHPDDLRNFLENDEECVGACRITTDDPVFLQSATINGREFAKGFSTLFGQWEWSGLVQLKSERMMFGTGHVYPIVEPLLPLPIIPVRAKEIDTLNDYERALQWVRNGYEEIEVVET